MANFWDSMNQNQDDYNLFGDDYKPTQSNVLGQSLAPVNNTGELSAVDGQNDQRTPYQMKQDAQQANAIASNAPDEDDDYITSANGNKYQKVENSKLQQSLAAAASYMENYFASNGNIGVAAKGAGQTLYNMDAKAHRLGQVDKLEEQGYNSLDIQNWINSGDKKDLVTNKGSWTSGGNGTMFNTLTGETRNIPGAVNDTAPIKTVDLGDRQMLYFRNGTQQEVLKGATPRFNAAGVNGNGSIGLDDDENAMPAYKDDGNGGVLKLSGYNRDGSPRYTAASQKDAEAYRSQGKGYQPDANQQLVSDDLDVVHGATTGQIDKFTGQYLGRMDTLRDFAASQDPEIRKIYNASTRLGTQLGNAAISAAKDAGASGINTEAEIKRFTSGVPQPDYTSEANYIQSIKDIETYANNFRDNLMNRYGVGTQQPAQPTQQPAQKQAAKKGVTHVERGPDGKLHVVEG